MRHRSQPIARTVAAALCLAAVAGCSATTVVPAPELDQHVPGLISKAYTVRLAVDGSDRHAKLVFSPGNSHEYGEDETELPWSKTVTASAGDYLYVSASAERRGVEMTCKVFVNGKLVDSDQPEHNHAECSASTVLPSNG